MRIHGKIAFWNDDRGFGFIEPHDGGDEVFVHIKAFRKKDLLRPYIDQSVTYKLSTDNSGRVRAVGLRYRGDRALLSAPNPKKTAIAFSTSFLLMLSVAVLLGRIHLVILIAYTIMSLFTFLLYAKDKSAAQRGTWRTPENSLHLCSILCGWPGALIAQQLLRHKSKKTSFRVVFWITVIVNGLALYWLFSEGNPILVEYINRIDLSGARALLSL